MVRGCASFCSARAVGNHGTDLPLDVEEVFSNNNIECLSLESVKAFYKTEKTFFWFCDNFARCALGKNDFCQKVDKEQKSVFEALSISDFAFLWWKLLENYTTWGREATKESAPEGRLLATVTTGANSSDTSALGQEGAEDLMEKDGSGSDPTNIAAGPPAKKKRKLLDKKSKLSNFKKCCETMLDFYEKKAVEYGMAYMAHRKEMLKKEKKGEQSSDDSSGASSGHDESEVTGVRWIDDRAFDSICPV